MNSEVLCIKESTNGDIDLYGCQLPSGGPLPLTLEMEYSSVSESSEVKNGNETYYRNDFSIEVGEEEILMEGKSLKWTENETVPTTSHEWKNTIRAPFEALSIEGETGFNISENVTTSPPFGWLLLKEAFGNDVVTKGLPGEVILRIPLNQDSSITYEQSDYGTDNKTYLKKKAEISSSNRLVSIRQSSEEKVYLKVKLEITVESAFGEVYVIHFLASVI